MFVLPELPWAPDALEPVVSGRTLGYHHGKHHKAYVDTVNRLLGEAGASPISLEAVIREAAGAPGRGKLFNNAAQAWNHAFFWDSMAPDATTPAAPPWPGPSARPSAIRPGCARPSLRKALTTSPPAGSGWSSSTGR